MSLFKSPKAMAVISSAGFELERLHSAGPSYGTLPGIYTRRSRRSISLPGSVPTAASERHMSDELTPFDWDVRDSRSRESEVDFLIDSPTSGNQGVVSTLKYNVGQTVLAAESKLGRFASQARSACSRSLLRFLGNFLYRFVGIALVAMLLILVISYFSSSLFNSDFDPKYIHRGSIASSLACTTIILTYWAFKRCRRHPAPIILWKSVADLAFSLRFLNVWMTSETSRRTCTAVAGIAEFTAISSESWFFCLALDLWRCGTSPFASARKNMSKYHHISWSTGVAAAIVLMIFFRPRIRHPLEDDIDTLCWFPSTAASWYLYHGWAVAVNFYALAVIIREKRERMKLGLEDTLRARARILSQMRLITAAFCMYQLCVIGFILLSEAQERALHRPHRLKIRQWADNALGLTYSLRGVIDLVVWVMLLLVNASNERGEMITSATSGSTKAEEERSENESGNQRLLMDKEFEEDEGSYEEYKHVRDQLNVAVRQEILYYTTKGIIAACEYSKRLREDRPVVHLLLKESGLQIRFSDFLPLSFLYLRRAFGIDEEDYKGSFWSATGARLGEGSDAGGSGAFLFFTGCRRFIVKTVTKAERRRLLRMVPSYAKHVKDNPGTYICRFYGCHSIKMYNTTFSFVIMGNVLGEESVHMFYDIKGSWISRNAKISPPGSQATCCYCNEEFTVGKTTTSACKSNFDRFHEPLVVRKDNDLQKNLRLSKPLAEELFKQLTLDVEYLRSQGIMDYSLLLGVRNCEFSVNWQDGTLFRSESSDPSVAQNDERQSTVPRPLVRGDEDHHESKRTGIVAHPPLPSAAVVGADKYYMGIVDILQTWTLEKRLERWWKSNVKRLDPNGISSIPPDAYARRFLRKMVDIVHVHAGPR